MATSVPVPGAIVLDPLAADNGAGIPVDDGGVGSGSLLTSDDASGAAPQLTGFSTAVAGGGSTASPVYATMADSAAGTTVIGGGTMSVTNSAVDSGSTIATSSLDVAAPAIAGGSQVVDTPAQLLSSQYMAGGTGAATVTSQDSVATGGTELAPEMVSYTNAAGASGLTINVTYDSNVTNSTSASSIMSAFGKVVSILESKFTNPITINVAVGWGEVPNTDGTPGSIALGGGSLGENSAGLFSVTSGFSTISAAMSAAGDKNLPSTDPTNGATFWTTTADARALNLATLQQEGNPQFDGEIGFASNQAYTFDPNNRAVAGKFDFIGVAEHELTEVLGRSSFDGTTFHNSAAFSPMDLYRYTATGQLALTSTTNPSYFSVDGGKTDLMEWNNASNQPWTVGSTSGTNNAGGDLGDWATTSATYTPDSFNAFSQPGFANLGVESTTSTVDLQNMQILGYTVACFGRGTLILTDRGEMPVENLSIGDRVVTLSGAAKPIKWVGHRAYDGRFVAGNHTVLPIRIAARALGDGLPRRDLELSPDHAVYIDGALVMARLLVNGTTIQRVERADRVEYFHIELDAHDIVLAEGMPSETYVERGNRGMFHNGGEYPRLYPGTGEVEAAFCAPRLEEGAVELVRIRAELPAESEVAAERHVTA